MEKRPFEISEIIYTSEMSSDTEFPNLPVYRFMSFESLLEILLSKKVPLRKTKYWEDTYENFLFKADSFLGEISFSLTSHEEKFYGSCWTRKCESDALWRIYSPAKCSVRIRSTVSKLAYCLQHEFDKSRAYSISIGKVEYLSIQQIVDHFSAISDEDFMAEATRYFRDSMFMKRIEFAHEDEVRIILDLKNEFIQNDVEYFSIDPRNVIEEITFDPRISDDQYNLFVPKLRAISFQEIASKSNLYSQDRLKIRFKESSSRFEII